MTSSFKWSRHARERWKERFPGINKSIELSSARSVGKKIKKRIKNLTPVNAVRYMNGFNGRYYLVGQSNIVFVIDSKDQIITTVFHVYGEDND